MGQLKQVLLCPEHVNRINRNSSSGTPLCTAIRHAHLGAVDTLLRAGADPLQTMADNVPSPFSMAIDHGDLAIVQRLWAEERVKASAHGLPSLPNCLIHVARCGRVNLMEFFLDFWGTMWTDDAKETALAVAQRQSGTLKLSM